MSRTTRSRFLPVFFARFKAFRTNLLVSAWKRPLAVAFVSAFSYAH